MSHKLIIIMSSIVFGFVGLTACNSSNKDSVSNNQMPELTIEKFSSDHVAVNSKMDCSVLLPNKLAHYAKPLTINLSSNSDSVSVSNCIVLPDASSCKFTISGIKEGEAKISASAIGYRNYTSDKIAVIGTDSLDLQVESIAEVDTNIHGKVNIQHSINKNIEVSILSSKTDIIQNESCTIIANTNYCDFTLHSKQSGTTYIKATSTGFGDSMEKSISVQEKSKLILTVKDEDKNLNIKDTAIGHVQSLHNVNTDTIVNVEVSSVGDAVSADKSCTIKQNTNNCDFIINANKLGNATIVAKSASYVDSEPVTINVIDKDQLLFTYFDSDHVSINSLLHLTVSTPVGVKNDLQIKVDSDNTSANCTIKQGNSSCTLTLSVGDTARDVNMRATADGYKDALQKIVVSKDISFTVSELKSRAFAPSTKFPVKITTNQNTENDVTFEVINTGGEGIMLDDKCTIHKGNNNCTLNLITPAAQYALRTGTVEISPDKIYGRYSLGELALSIKTLYIATNTITLKVGAQSSEIVYMPYGDSIEADKLITINSNNHSVIKDTSCKIAKDKYQCQFNIKADAAGSAAIWASSDKYQDSKIIAISAH